LCSQASTTFNNKTLKLESLWILKLWTGHNGLNNLFNIFVSLSNIFNILLNQLHPHWKPRSFTLYNMFVHISKWCTSHYTNIFLPIFFLFWNLVASNILTNVPILCSQNLPQLSITKPWNLKVFEYWSYEQDTMVLIIYLNFFVSLSNIFNILWNQLHPHWKPRSFTLYNMFVHISKWCTSHYTNIKLFYQYFHYVL
jgi:hypothetical protein